MSSSIMSRRARHAVLLVALGVLAGCGAEGPQRGAIFGRVTVGGQPLKEGRILFTPQKPNQGPTASAHVRDGLYNLNDVDGPVLGVNRVEIESIPELGFAIDDEAAFANRGGKPLPPNPIPPEYNSRSTQTCDVQAGENEFNVDVSGYSGSSPLPR